MDTMKPAVDAIKRPLAREPRPNLLQQAPLIGLCLFFAFLFLRPGDLIPELVPLRPVLSALVLAVIAYVMTGRRIVFLRYDSAKWLLALLLMMGLSTMFSYWPGGSTGITINFVKEIVAFVLIANIVTNHREMRRVIVVIALCNAALALFAIKDFMSGHFTRGRIQGVVGGLFSDPNDLALSLVTAVPLVYWLIQRQTHPTRRLLYTSLLGVIVGGVVASQSRGGFIALLAVVLLVLRVSRQKRLAIAAGVAILVAVIVIAPDGAFERFSTIKNFDQEETSRIRLHMWKSGLAMFLDHPVTGVGTGMFSVAYGQDYRSPDFPYNTWWTAHNSVIQVAAELGLPGLVLWFGLIASGLATLRRTRAQLGAAGPESADLSEAGQLNIALRNALFGFLIGALFLSRAYDWLLVIVLGLILAGYRMTEPGSGRVRRPESVSSGMRPAGAGPNLDSGRGVP